MSKRQDTTPFTATFEQLTPGAFLEPWMKAQASMASTMRDMAEHWYARRTADMTALQDATARLAGCTSPESFAQAQTQCASMLAERFMADLSGLREDMLALGNVATSALGAAATSAKSAPKLAAE